MERDARQRAEALDRFWDDLLADGAAERPPEVDEVYAATMRRVNALGDVPGLVPARERIWQSLAQRTRAATKGSATPDTVAFSVSILESAPNGRVAPDPGPLRLPPVVQQHRRWTPAHWALAALLVLTTVAGLVALGQERLRPEAIVMTAPQFMGRFEGLWRSTGGAEPLVYPQGLAVDPGGNIWVIDGGNNRIQIFAADGTLLETWGSDGSAEGEFDFSASGGVAAARGAGYRGDLAFDRAGNLYVVDSGNHRVQKFAPDRTFLFAFGSEGEGEGQFITAMTIAVGPDGSIYVGDEDRGDIQTFDATGQYQGTIGAYELEDGKPSAPSSVAVDHRGFVWVTDRANHRVARFAHDGGLLDVWGVRGTRPGELFNPADLAIDEAGLVYVIDRDIHRIQLFAPDGRYLAEIRSEFGSLDDFTAPQAVAVGGDGLVYVSSEFAVHAFRIIEHVGDALMP